MVKQYKREPLTSDEANELALACRTTREKVIVWTLLDTGVRVSELCSITQQSLDWQRHLLRVYGKGGPYGSRSKFRVVPLSDRLAGLLERWLSVHDDLGVRPRTVQKLVKRVASRAAIARPVTPHVLRHTFAVECIRRGISVAVVQRLLGHDHLSSTAVYLNLSPEDVIRGFRAGW